MIKNSKHNGEKKMSLTETVLYYKECMYWRHPFV
jgi:hypothetical protein